MSTKCILKCIFLIFFCLCLNEIELYEFNPLKETRGLRNGTNLFNDFWYTNMQKISINTIPKPFNPNFRTQYI